MTKELQNRRSVQAVLATMNSARTSFHNHMILEPHTRHRQGNDRRNRARNWSWVRRGVGIENRDLCTQWKVSGDRCVQNLRNDQGVVDVRASCPRLHQHPALSLRSGAPNIHVVHSTSRLVSRRLSLAAAI